MEIQSAEFVKSCPSIKVAPNTALPEYAFIGRSNVGKSSLINMLVNRKNLAQTSSTPGKTQLINYFIINAAWHLVDLPGYGFAKRSKKIRDSWGKMISDYISKRDNLVNTFVLIDSRIKPQVLDLVFIRNLAELGVAFTLVFTKTDKLKQRELDKNLEIYKEELSKEWEELPPIIVTSANTKLGRKEILEFIATTNKMFFTS
ncbi:MAG: ribosome biogenesis GTP-binding protein YihA/YsxC [Bacteroidota bacterium]|nr:ribosome biogenesis GTP-binding protein YihA/YsxC [Bacteroidota bacterium]